MGRPREVWPFAHRKGLQEKDKVWLLREQKRKKKLRKLLKRLQNNDTCSMPGLTCFTHDNQHWQTAPLWTREQARGQRGFSGTSPCPLARPYRSFGNRFPDIRGQQVLPTGPGSGDRPGQEFLLAEGFLPAGTLTACSLFPWQWGPSVPAPAPTTTRTGA